MKQIVSTADAPRPSGSYSQGILTPDLLFTAGVGPHDPATGEVRGATIREQTFHTLRNLEAVLIAAGLTRADVVKVAVHLAHLERDFADYDEVYREFFQLAFKPRA